MAVIIAIQLTPRHGRSGRVGTQEGSGSSTAEDDLYPPCSHQGTQGDVPLIRVLAECRPGSALGAAGVPTVAEMTAHIH